MAAAAAAGGIIAITTTVVAATTTMKPQETMVPISSSVLKVQAKQANYAEYFQRSKPNSRCGIARTHRSLPAREFRVRQYRYPFSDKSFPRIASKRVALLRKPIRPFDLASSGRIPLPQTDGLFPIRYIGIPHLGHSHEKGPGIGSKDLTLSLDVIPDDETIQVIS